MLKKNDYITGECIDYTHDALGIVKVDQFLIFVKNMIKGEVGKVKIIKVLKNYAVGRLISLDQTSIHRVDPICPIFNQCGGCHIQYLDNAGQQAFKTNRVKETLHKIGHVDVKVLPTIMMEEPYYYRNKVQVPVGTSENQLITGFYKPHTNEIVKQDYCFLQNEESNLIIKRVRELLQFVGETSFNKVNHKGNIKHILLRSGYHTHEVMLVFITYTNKIKDIKYICDVLLNEFPNIKTIIQNINPRHDNVILGEKVKVLYGKGYIEDILLDNTYRISAKSFYQVNPIQVEKLYSIAIDLAQVSSNDTILDAYCGIGTIGLSVSKYCKKVIGVEIVTQAIIDAKENALRNNIHNAEFYCDDAGNFISQYKGTMDIAFVDPPRKGCTKEFLDYLVQFGPKKIVYISCNVSTQARDINYIKDYYKVETCQPVDMFPQSHHVETVVLLRREK